MEPKTTLSAVTPRYQPFVEAIQDFAEDAGFTLYPRYSGRGMFGKTCIGMVIPAMRHIADIYFHLGWVHHTVNVEYPDHATDNIGLDIIVYWPQCEVVECNS